MDEKDKIEKVAKEFGEIIVTKKIKEEIDIKVIKKK